MMSPEPDFRFDGLGDYSDAGPIRESYTTLALVSCTRHLDALEPRDDSLLVVATEWFTWRVARERGFDSVHYEAFRGEWPLAEAGDKFDLVYSATDWGWDDKRALTLYRGVSLAELYGAFLALSWQAIAILHSALATMCRRLKPRRIILFDLASHFDVLSPAAKRQLVHEIAGPGGIAMEDRLDPVRPGDSDLALQACMAPCPARHPTLRDRLRDGAAACVEALFRLRLWRKRRVPKVFLYISNASLKNLVAGFSESNIVPLFPFQPSPKGRAFMANCWRRGLLPIRLRNAGSETKRRAAAEAMMGAVKAHWAAHPARGIAAVHRLQVEEAVLRLDILCTGMALVDQAIDVLDRFGIQRFVSGDLTSPIGHAMAELARNRGIAVDETLNGVFVDPVRIPVRCGGRSLPPALSRELGFGPSSPDWLAVIQATPVSVITGYPALGCLRPGRTMEIARSHALILPGVAWFIDFDALQGNITTSLIEMVRALARLGFTDIRIKLHPDKNVAGYFDRIRRAFDLPCSIHQSEPINQLLDWADVVIGPAGTNVFLEALAIAKPYFILRPRPTSVPDSFYPGAVFVDTGEALVQAINAGILPDRDRLLAYWCALGAIDDPVRATWAAISEAVETDKGAVSEPDSK